jgi:hypothetical protein
LHHSDWTASAASQDKKKNENCNAKELVHYRAPLTLFRIQRTIPNLVVRMVLRVRQAVAKFVLGYLSLCLVSCSSIA